MGYYRAGFTSIVGVDNKPQKNFPFTFVQADALEYLTEDGHEFDVIHASPPCQAYSRATAWRGSRTEHPDMIAATRWWVEATGRPYVIENVQEARRLLRFPIMLCGSLFGLRLQRHRYFECPWLPLAILPACQHAADDYSFDHGGKQSESVYRDAMGCNWMTVHEARQAIPPAYTEYIGKQVLRALEASP